jgi:hypothetical protein
VPNLVENDARGRHVLVRFSELLGEQLSNALILLSQFALERRHPSVG